MTSVARMAYLQKGAEMAGDRDWHTGSRYLYCRVRMRLCRWSPTRLAYWEGAATYVAFRISAPAARTNP